MTRQVTDQLYIELDYFTPEEYYVYIAEAAATATATANFTVSAGLVKEATATATAEAAVLATISNIKGVDIVLAPFASFSATGELIKEAMAALASEATLSADAEVILGGNVEEASAALTSEFTTTFTVEKITGFSATLASEFSQTAQAEIVFNVDSTQTSAFTLGVDASANRSTAVTLETIGNLNAQADRITDTSALIDSALSATLTATVLKNHTAILESSFAFTADAITVSESSATLNATASQSTLAERLAGLSSALSATATATITIDAVRQISSELTSQFTLSAQGLDVDLAEASLSVTSNLSADLNIFYPSYTWVNENFSPVTYSSTRKRFGSHAVIVPYRTTTDKRIYLSGQNAISTNLLAPGSQNFTIEFYLGYLDNFTETTDDFLILSSNSITLTRKWNASQSEFYVLATFQNSNFVTHTLNDIANPGFGALSFSLGSIRHFVIQRDGDVFSIYASGQLQISSTISNFGSLRDPVVFSLWGKSGSLRDVIYDEFRYTVGLARYSGSSYTLPSSEFVRDNNTRALTHFNNTLEVETTNMIVSQSAALLSEFTTSAQANEIIGLSASMSAAGFVLTTAGYLLDDLADLNSTTAMSVDADLIAEGQISATAESALSAQGGYVKEFQFDVICETEYFIVGSAVRGGAGSLSTAANTNIDSDRIRGFSANFTALGSQLTIAGLEINQTATLASEFTTSITADRIRDNSAQANSEFTLSILGGTVFEDTAALAISANMAVSGDRIRFADSSMSASAEMSATGAVIAEHTVNISTISQAEATANLIRDFDCFTFGITVADIDVNVITENQSTQNSQAQQTTSANYISDITVNGQAVGFVITVIANTSETNSDIHSESTLSATANFTQLAQVSAQAQTSLTVVPTRVFDFDIVYRQPRGIDLEQNTLPWPFLQGSTASGTYGALIMSVWAGGVGDENPNGPLFSADTFQGPGNYSLNIPFSIQNNTVRYSVYYDGYVEWSVPNTKGYHHYLMRINLAESTNALKYQLWVDGIPMTANVFKTNTSQPSPPNYQLTLDTTNFPMVLVGSGSLGAQIWDSSSSEPAVWASQFNGQITQWYFNYTNSYTNTTFPVTDNDRQRFYRNGFVDLGVYGTDTGLPRPRNYLALPNFVNSTSIPDRGTINGSWEWNKLEDSGPFFEPYLVNNYTASASDNSTLELIDSTTARFNLTASAQSVQIVNVQMNSISTISVQVRKNVQAQSNINATAVVSASIQVLKPANSNLTAVSTLSVNTANLIQAEADLTTVAAITTIGELYQGSSATLSSQFTGTFVTGFLGRGQANLTSTATMSISADKIKDVLITVGSNMTVSAGANYTVSAQITAESQGALHATADKIRANQADLLSDAALSATVVRTARTGTAISSTTTFSAQAMKIVGVSANLPAISSTLTVGDVIQLDPYLTYVIEPETRYYTINRETRFYTVEAETREYTIQGYNL